MTQQHRLELLWEGEEGRCFCALGGYGTIFVLVSAEGVARGLRVALFSAPHYYDLWFLLYPGPAFEQLYQGQTLALVNNLEEVPLPSSLVLEYLLQH